MLEIRKEEKQDEKDTFKWHARKVFVFFEQKNYTKERNFRDKNAVFLFFKYKVIRNWIANMLIP
jgi:hypothetical protein